MTCAAAYLADWTNPANSWYPNCAKRREWGCNQPQQVATEDYLICVCQSLSVTPATIPTAYPAGSPSAGIVVPPTSGPSPRPLPTVKPTNIPIAPSYKPTNIPIAPTYRPFKPTINPTTAKPKPSKRLLRAESTNTKDSSTNIISNVVSSGKQTPTPPPSQSPVIINPPGKYVASSCLQQLSGDDYQPQQFCLQDLVQNTCTVQASLRPNNAAKGSCADHCQRHGLQCLSAYTNDWGGCVGLRSISCTEERTDWSAVIIISNKNLNGNNCS